MIIMSDSNKILADGKLNFDNYQTEIIGSGICALNVFDDLSGSVKYNSGVEHINQSIRHILGTRIGTRFFLPEFGSKLYSLIFEPNDEILKELIIQYSMEALEQWEPRITNIQVTPYVKTFENLVPVRIDYQLINTNIVHNYVFPFNRQLYEVNSYQAPAVDTNSIYI